MILIWISSKKCFVKQKILFNESSLYGNWTVSFISCPLQHIDLRSNFWIGASVHNIFLSLAGWWGKAWSNMTDLCGVFSLDSREVVSTPGMAGISKTYCGIVKNRVIFTILYLL